MAAVVSQKLRTPPPSQTRGTKGQTHVLQIECEVDKLLPGDFVLVLAQEIVGTLPATNPDGSPVTEVPNNGDRLFWAQEKLIQDVYAAGDPGVTAFAAAYAGPDDDPYADPGAVALDFDIEVLPGGCNKTWLITVTYRPPEPGQNEQPAQVLQLVAGNSTPSSGMQNPIPGGGIPFTGAIYDASIERWVEQRPIRFPVNQGYEVTDLTAPYVVSAIATPMRMPNWEEYPPFEVDAMLDVLVIARNVENEHYGTVLNGTYGNTTNSDAVTLGTRSMAKYTILYENTRTGRVNTKTGSTYYRAETRLILLPQPNFVWRQAFGTYYLDGAVKRKSVDADGVPIDRIPLKNDGTVATIEADIASRVYSKEKPVAYSTEFGYT